MKKLAILSKEEIMKAHDGEKCRDCGESIAIAQRDSDYKDMLRQFRELLDKLTVVGDEEIRKSLYTTEWKVFDHKRRQYPRTNMSVHALYVNEKMFGYILDKPEEKDWFSIYKGDIKYAKSTIAKHSLEESKQALLDMAIEDMCLPKVREEIAAAQLQADKDKLLSQLEETK